MASNEIVVKDIMTDCHETEELLKQLQQEKDELYTKGEEYYKKYNSHPPIFLREYIESVDRVDALQKQLDRLQLMSKEIAPEYQACQSWLEKAKQGEFECEVNLFKQPHSERDLGKENNVLASTALSTTLKFVYADDKKEVVDNGYIFYWVYDEHIEDKIEDDQYIKFTTIARPMLPVGVGRTDKNGQLRKSMFFKQNTFSHIQDEKKHYIKLNLKWDKNFTNLKPKSGKSLSENIQDSMSHWNKFGQLQGSRPFYLEHSKANRGHFDRELNTDERNLQDLYAFHLSQEDFEKAETLIKNIKGNERQDFFKQVSNQYFYLFKPYGFMCYPIDRGSFVTKDLKELTSKDENNFSVAWKGYLNPEKTNPPEMTIPIHCTLPEWDRRVQRQIRRLKKAQDVYFTALRPHNKAIAHLDGMLQSATCYGQYSADILREKAELEILEKSSTKKIDKRLILKESNKTTALIDNIKSIQNSIEEAIEDEKNSDHNLSLKEHLDDIEVQANKLRSMLKSKALITEFKRYWGENGPEENKDGVLKAGPDMQEEPYWVHFIHTYCESIIILRSTPLGSQIFKEDISPVLDVMIETMDWSGLLPGGEFNDILESVDVLFDDKRKDKNNLIIGSLKERLEQLDKKSNKFQYENDDSLFYILLKGWKEGAGTLFHRVPGPPSVLQTVLDVYADHISKKIQRNTLQKGKGSYHIKFMLFVCQKFGVLKIGNEVDNLNTLYSALRAHGRMHSSGSKNQKGGKNYYSHSALKARRDYLSGQINLIVEQKDSLNKIMESVEATKHFIFGNFNQRPFPGFSADSNQSGSFSDVVYTENKHLVYKSVMGIVNLCFLTESLGNLPKDSTKHWDEGEYLRYAALLTDSLGGAVLTTYQTSNLITNLRLTYLVNKMEQAKQSSLIFWQNVDKKHKSIFMFMDNLSASLSVLGASIAVMDAIKYQKQGKTEEQIASWLKAAGAGMTVYGFYAGKYAADGAFAYLSRKVGIRMSRTLAFAGAALFIPGIGEGVAVVGAILNTVMLAYDVLDIIHNYNKSTLLQQFDFHHEQFSNMNTQSYFALDSGEVRKKYKAIGKYDGLITGLNWDDLHTNAVIPLITNGMPEEQVIDMMENDYRRMISELIDLSDTLNSLRNTDSYYIIDEKKETVQEIIKRLNDGQFFDKACFKTYEQIQFLGQYRAYNRLPYPKG
ncbi:MAG: hypothetical protein OQL19_10435 [Gammaproteobacteria bacterium]|nr:hypothetical protein [Gammaproteobacteria bacterium]